MIARIKLKPLSIEELVIQDLRRGQKIHKHRNVWWREVKPFFYMPTWFLSTFKPEEARPNPFKSIGGYYHIVPEGSYTNGSICVMFVDQLSEYSLENLSNSRTRYNIRHGLRNVQICLVPELEHLLTDGYEVYLSWRHRIGRIYKDRSNPILFRNWITNEYSLPNRLILGAYVDNRLIAFLMGYAVEDTAIMTMLFSHSEYHRLHPVDALFYSFILICKQHPGIKRVCAGLKGTRSTLNDFKNKHGFKEVIYPAYIKMNPLIRPVVKTFMREKYKRLMCHYQD